MSLLMDALKKAEQAKLQGQADASTVSAPDLVLEPLASGDAPPRLPPESLPELSRLEDLDKEFIALARKSAPQVGANISASEAARRDAVRNAFAVKGAEGTSRNFVIIAMAAALLAFGAIGIYFWVQIKPIQGLEQQPTMVHDMAFRQAPTPTPTVTPVVHTASNQPAPETARQAPVATRPRPLTAKEPGKPAQTGAMVPSAAGDEQSIRLARAAPGIDPSVVEGYKRLQVDDQQGAKAAYLRALQADPRNTDALHGLAAIALRQGKVDDAAAIYQRILDINPGNATAEASLLALLGSNDQIAHENRLRALLATGQGDQASVNFALGNLYARNNRWQEAQQAYFNAVTVDGSNPDYLFNLAVALDHLRQPTLAAQYYRQALTVSEGRKAVAFDRAQVVTRLSELAN